MSTEFLSSDISPELQEEYQNSLAKIDALCRNDEVMNTISDRLPNCGEIDDEKTYMKNIENTLSAWKSNYTDDTCRV